MAEQPEDKPELSDDSVESTPTNEEVKTSEFAEAFTYFDSIDREFGANSEEYRYILDVLKDFKNNKKFIEGFIKFLPGVDKTALPLSQSYNVEIIDAARYVMKVKTVSSQNKERLTSFLELLNGYYTAEPSLLDLTRKMCDLLRDRQDVLKFLECLLHLDRAAMQNAVNNAAKDEDLIVKTKSTSL